ncbi:MAG: hypothetical protein WB755_18515 [Terriglobales bacterium]
MHAICDCADDDGHAFPSINYLVWKTGLPRRTVILYMQEFRKLGVIVDLGRRSGIDHRILPHSQRDTSVICVRLENLPAKPPWLGKAASAAVALGGVQPLRQASAAIARPSAAERIAIRKEPSGTVIKPSILPQTAFADAPGVLSDDTKTSKPTDAQIERLYGAYPRKRDKLDAKKAIRKAVSVVMAGDADHPAMPLEDALNYLAQRITLYARCVQDCEPRYVPYPASWFNAGGFWDDERDWAKKQNSKPPGPVPLPTNYVPPSEQLRRENAARAR